jgi:2-hydroxychromene-2-carboxylate isomerase
MADFDFFYFIGSTYTYLTVMRIEALAAKQKISVTWRPFNVRSIMIEQNNIPFRGKPVKMKYMWRDIERRATLHHIPFNGPPVYPVDPDDLAGRVAILAAEQGWCPEYTKATYRAWFMDNKMPGDPAHLDDLLQKLGKAPAPIVAEANSERIRARYAAETDVARELGIFGSPTFARGQELFWGDDRLEEALTWDCGA